MSARTPFLALWRVAVRNLLQGGRRSMLLALAVAMVTALLVLLSALSAGLESTMIRSASTLMSGHVNVGGFYKATRTQAAPVVTDLAKIRAMAEAETARISPVDQVIDRLRGWGKLISPSGSFMAGIVGVDIREERRLREVIQLVPSPEGVPTGDLDALAEPGTALIFEGQAARLNVRVGDMLTLVANTLGGQRNTADLRIVAIAKDIGFLSATTVFVPKSSVQGLYQIKKDATGAVQIYLKNPEEAPLVMEALRPKLEAAGYTLMDHDPRPFFMKFERVSGEDWRGQKLDVTTWRDEVSFLLWILTGFNTVRWLLLGGLLIIVVVGIMNTLWMTIRERTRELGTLRAVGMKRSGVLLMILFEGLALGLFSATTGALAGALIAVGLDAAALYIPMQAFQMVLMSDHLHLVTRPGDLFSAIAIVSTITTFAGLLPAWRAARMRPVNAIHHVG